MQAVDADIARLDQMIAELQQKRKAAEEGSKNFFNQYLPDFPLQRDGDGVPWRVRADDYEDQWRHMINLSMIST